MGQVVIGVVDAGCVLLVLVSPLDYCIRAVDAELTALGSIHHRQVLKQSS